MAYIREDFIKQNTFVKICVIILMMITCVVATPFSIGSHLAGVFIMKED
jgi:hypothetical protein